MRLPTIAALGILILALNLCAQAPDTVWTRKYAGPGGAMAMSVVPAAGGGYFVGATIIVDTVVTSGTFKNGDIWVLRLDEQGDTLWSRIYGESDWHESIAQLIATADGGFAFAGNREGRPREAQQYVLKADAQGEPQWQAEYPDLESHGWIVGLDQMANNDIVLAYNILDHGRDFGVKQLYGGWGDDLQGAGGEMFHIRNSWAMDDEAGSVTASSDGGFAVCGWTESVLGMHDVLFLMKSTQFGIIEWTRICDSLESNGAGCVKETSDGGFIVAGSANRTVSSPEGGLYLLRLNAAGDKLWSRSYGDQSRHAGNDVIELSDGGFLATGWNGITVRVSSAGEKMWLKTYGPSPVALWSAAQSPDGGYVLAGWQRTLGVYPDFYSAYLIKLAPDEIPTVVDDEVKDLLPTSVGLAQNYPNPFNPSTMIEFELARPSHVTIEVFNLLGRKTRTLLDESKPAGPYRVEWTGTDDTGKPVATGVYLYRLEAGDIVETKKMLLLK